jgi:Holliday junction resolvase
MPNPSYNKRKGSAFEIAVMKFLRAKNLLVERLRLAGKDDEGDLVCLVAGRPYIFELKATAKMDLPQFWREATTEAFNYARVRGLDVVPPAYVIVKRRMASIEQSWVIQDLNQWLVTQGVEK